MKFVMLPLDKIEVMPEQSRQNFTPEALENLTASIEELGQLQPVIVRRNKDVENDNDENDGDEEKYQLIAGERRFKALQSSESHQEIAALVVDEDLPPERIREINLAENLQREDLDEMERARGIRAYMERHDLNRSEASSRLGVPRTTLSEWLQILEIKPEYQEAVLDDDCALTLSHVSLALGLGSTTGNPVLTDELIEAIIKFNLTRHEAQKISDLYNRHLYLEMEEAVGAVLIDRERQKAAADLGDLLDEEKRRQPLKEMLKSLARASEKMEEYMEEIGHLEPGEEKRLIDEFLYIYQMMKMLVPGLEEKTPEDLLEEYRQHHG